MLPIYLEGSEIYEIIVEKNPLWKIAEFCCGIILEPLQKKYSINGQELYDTQALNLTQYFLSTASWHDVVESAIENLFKPEQLQWQDELIKTNIEASIAVFLEDLCATHPCLYQGLVILFLKSDSVSIVKKCTDWIVREENQVYQKFADAIDQMKYQILP
jgi:hypothetical protein